MIDWDTCLLGPVHDVFGEAITYVSPKGVSVQLVGIFDKAYKNISLIDNAPEVSSEQPVVGVRLSQFPDGTKPQKGGKVQVPSVSTTYTVRDIEADGHGEAKLLLHLPVAMS